MLVIQMGIRGHAMTTAAFITLIMASASLLGSVPVATAQAIASNQTSPSDSRIRDATEYSAYKNVVSLSAPAIRATAIEIFLQQYPNSAVKNDLLELLIDTYLATANTRKTLATAHRLLQLDPNNPRALALEASIDPSAGLVDDRAPEAQNALNTIELDADSEKYREELQKTPKNSLAHFRLGESLVKGSDLQSAANQFRAALDGDPHPKWIDAWAHIDLGEIFDTTHQLNRAIHEYQAAVGARDDTDGAQAIAVQRLEGMGISEPILHRVSSEDFPSPTVEIPAQYSVEGRLARLEGTVYLAGTVAADGSARDLRIVQSLGLGLDDAAEAAASRSTFEPARIDNVVAPKPTTIRVDFLLSSKESRWHLLRVAFATPQGASRPHFVSAPYPGGDGIGPAAADAARLLAAMGRRAVVALAFDVDEAGRPVRIRVQEATEPALGDQAVSIVRRWQFSPANKDGRPSSTSCTVDLVWGEKEFTQDSLRASATEFGSLLTQRGEIPSTKR
jgi:TonB family protein